MSLKLKKGETLGGELKKFVEEYVKLNNVTSKDIIVIWMGKIKVRNDIIDLYGIKPEIRCDELGNVKIAFINDMRGNKIKNAIVEDVEIYSIS